MKKLLVIVLVVAVLLAVILVPAVALASDGSEVIPVDWTQLIIAAVGLVFSAIIIPLVKVAFEWLKGKTHNEALQSALSEAQALADTIVASLQQTVVEGLKAKSKDGKLTAVEAKQVYEMAVNRFLSEFSAKSTTLLENNAKDFIQFVTDLLEARLLRLKEGK